MATGERSSLRLIPFVPEGFVHEIDEHGAHRIAPLEKPAFTLADLRLDVLPIGPEQFQPTVTRAVAAHRMTLSDSRVMHAEVVPDGYFGGSHWEYVIAYRAGIFSYTLFLWFVHLPDRESAISIAGACASEDAPIFHTVFRLIIQETTVEEVDT